MEGEEEEGAVCPGQLLNKQLRSEAWRANKQIDKHEEDEKCKRANLLRWGDMTSSPALLGSL